MLITSPRDAMSQPYPPSSLFTACIKEMQSRKSKVESDLPWKNIWQLHKEQVPLLISHQVCEAHLSYMGVEFSHQYSFIKTDSLELVFIDFLNDSYLWGNSWWLNTSFSFL